MLTNLLLGRSEPYFLFSNDDCYIDSKWTHIKNDNRPKVFQKIKLSQLIVNIILINKLIVIKVIVYNLQAY